MYVVNPKKIDAKKLYSCNGVIANWLIYEKHLPLFGRGEKGEWFFVKTSKLTEALKDMPFYYRLYAKFS